MDREECVKAISASVLAVSQIRLSLDMALSAGAELEVIRGLARELQKHASAIETIIPEVEEAGG